jgi:hypothetical protein
VNYLQRLNHQGRAMPVLDSSTDDFICIKNTTALYKHGTNTKLKPIVWRAYIMNVMNGDITMLPKYNKKML